jgi:hypothetical protein
MQQITQTKSILCFLFGRGAFLYNKVLIVLAAAGAEKHN